MAKISDKILTSPDHQTHPLIFGKMLVSLLLFSEASLDLHKVKKKHKQTFLLKKDMRLTGQRYLLRKQTSHLKLNKALNSLP